MFAAALVDGFGLITLTDGWLRRQPLSTLPLKRRRLLQLAAQARRRGTVPDALFGREAKQRGASLDATVRLRLRDWHQRAAVVQALAR